MTLTQARAWVRSRDAQDRAQDRKFWALCNVVTEIAFTNRLWPDAAAAVGGMDSGLVNLPRFVRREELT